MPKPKDKDQRLALDTELARGLGWLEPTTRGVAPAIYPSTNYARDTEYQKAQGRGYTRDDNPGYAQVEALLKHIEVGADALVFASGMAAATTVFLALAPGDHVIASQVMYFGLRDWLHKVGKHWGLKIDFVPPSDLAALGAALRPGATKLVWFETPCNPTWDVTDIAAAAKLTHGAGALLAIDSTAATPILTQPLALGADLVMHSATKYLNGHGDVLAGALITARDDDFWKRIRYLRFEGGAMLGPFECWLLLRGMRTLHLRVARSCASALFLARRLEGHAKVAEVLYPGLQSHKGHAIARQQMRGGFGGMLSLRVKGGAEAALAIAKATRLFVRTTSLGGIESLIEHRATIEGETSLVPKDLLRLSIGIEEAEDLAADLEQALDRA